MRADILMNEKEEDELSALANGELDKITDDLSYKAFLNYVALFHPYTVEEIAMIKARMPEAVDLRTLDGWRKNACGVVDRTRPVRTYYESGSGSIIFRNLYDVSMTDCESAPAVPEIRINAGSLRGKSTLVTASVRYCVDKLNGRDLSAYWFNVSPFMDIYGILDEVRNVLNTL